MRMVWVARLGYPTSELRDSVFAAFAAQAGQHQDHLTPSTWVEQYPDVPAGLTSGITVDSMPGFSFCYDIGGGWENTGEWATLSDIAQEPSEGGGQQLSQLPE